MTFLELFLIAIGLSMDAFSVSICKGLTTKRFSWRMALVCGLWFGGFQALMPTIGYFLGAQFQEMIEAYDHWIALKRKEKTAEPSISRRCFFWLSPLASMPWRWVFRLPASR